MSLNNRESYAGHFTLNLSGLSSKRKRAFKRHLYGLVKKGVLDKDFYRFEMAYGNLVQMSIVVYIPDNPNDRDQQLEARRLNQVRAEEIGKGLQQEINRHKK